MAHNASSSTPPVDFVPGTVHLVDLDGTMHSRHAQGGKHDVVLVPAPSSDPDDPLNWKPRRKQLLTFCICVYCLAVGYCSAAIYSVLVPISGATNLSVDNLNTGTGYMFLAFGWGCLVWQPLAQKYGKRPVYLASLLVSMGTMIWAPHATTNGQWIANKTIQGFFGAPIESLCEISMADVYFAHERGTYVGLYALVLVGSNFLAPVFSGFINDGQGWEWVLHWCSIFCGGAFLINFLFMEETNFQRKSLLDVEDPGHESSNEVINDQASPIPDAEKAYRSPVSTDISPGFIVPECSNKSFLQKMKLFRREDLENKVSLMGMVTRPFLFALFPVVLFSGFMYGAIVCYFNALNATASLILSNSPYNFSASMVGLSYLACIIGVIVGSLYSGPLGDKFILWKARRNHGVLEPEHRLWLYTTLLLTVPGGLLLWGVGAYHHVHWFGLLFAMSITAMSITIGCQLPISYCIDSYKDLSADAMVTVIVIRNTMSFGFSYGITPWVTNMGFQNAFIVAAFTALAQIAIFLIFIKWGRQIRKSSSGQYWKILYEVKSKGFLH